MPAAKLASRYTRLWPRVATVVPHCHRAVFYDNSTDDGPSDVASYRNGLVDYLPRWPDWTPEPLLAL